MNIIKLIIAGFLVFLNIFSFILIKCQKNDREKKILQGVAKGNASDIDFDEKTAKPDKEEQETAKELNKEDEKEESEDKSFTDTENFMPKDKQQTQEEKSKILDKYGKKPISDLKLFLCCVLGGSLGTYIALFVFRYRLRDIAMMVLVPTILVLNIYLYLQVFTVWLILPLNNTVVTMLLNR